MERGAQSAQGASSVALLDFRRRPYLLALCLALVLVLINGVLQTGFFRPAILVSNLTAFLPLIIIATGQTYIVLGGSIDLSLGAIVSLVNVIVVVIITALGGGPAAIAAGIVAGLAAGAAGGALNGWIISSFRLQPIVTTFATSIIFSGLALVVLPQAGGALPPAYYGTYAGSLLGLPFVLVVLVALCAAAWQISRMRFYLHLLAVGGRRQAAFQTGLKVGAIRVASHAIGGLMAGVAALCILGVAGAGDPLMGQAFTLGSVSAVVLGGTALTGGWGGVVGSILGAAILGLINNVIFFANINYVYQSVVQGIMILLALAAGVFVSRRPG